MSEFEGRLVAARAGDEVAFGLLFRSVQPLLLRYLRTLGGSGLSTAGGSQAAGLDAPE